MQLWGTDESIKKSETNSKNRRGGHEVAVGLTRVALFQLENIARDLLLKRVGIQHQPSYICTYIRMVMMESLLLMSVLELSMKHMKRSYGKKWYLNLILINLKHITKLRADKRREEYTVLYLKRKLTTSISFVPHHLYDLQFLNQHQQQIWMNL